MQRIVFLHHSTGKAVVVGDTAPWLYRVTGQGDVHKYFARYNRKHQSSYEFTMLSYPGEEAYGGANYPYDYYDIWVKHAGAVPYKGQPTLEMLVSRYDAVVFKHCFPVGFILEDAGAGDVNSREKRLENYRLQYQALKEKMQTFPEKVFIVWTPPPLLKECTTPEQAIRTQTFYRWMKEQWDEANDNIFLWDFYHYATEGSLYMNPDYARGPGDSHPNRAFAARMAPLFADFMIQCLNQRNNHP